MANVRSIKYTVSKKAIARVNNKGSWDITPAAFHHPSRPKQRS